MSESAVISLIFKILTLGVRKAVLAIQNGKGSFSL